MWICLTVTAFVYISQYSVSETLHHNLVCMEFMQWFIYSVEDTMYFVAVAEKLQNAQSWNMTCKQRLVRGWYPYIFQLKKSTVNIQKILPLPFFTDVTALTHPRHQHSKQWWREAIISTGCRLEGIRLIQQQCAKFGNENLVTRHQLVHIHYTLCPNKKGTTDFFAVTFTNINGFSYLSAQVQLHKRMPKYY